MYTNPGHVQSPSLNENPLFERPLLDMIQNMHKYYNQNFVSVIKNKIQFKIKSIKKNKKTYNYLASYKKFYEVV